MIRSSCRTVGTFLFLLLSAIAAAASSSSSSLSDDRHKILAVPVPVSNTQGVAKRPKSSKGKNNNAPNDDDTNNGLQPFTVQARTTLTMNNDAKMII
jgi:hypothetical protein